MHGSNKRTARIMASSGKKTKQRDSHAQARQHTSLILRTALADGHELVQVLRAGNHRLHLRGQLPFLLLLLRHNSCDSGVATGERRDAPAPRLASVSCVRYRTDVITCDQNANARYS